MSSIRPDPQRDERNLRNAIRLFTPYQVRVYGQDLVDILAELDATRRQRDEFKAAALAAVEMVDQASPIAMRSAAAGGRRG